VHGRAVLSAGARGAGLPLAVMNNLARRRHVFASFPEYSGKIGAGVRGVQRIDAVFGCGNDDRVCGHGAPKRVGQGNRPNREEFRHFEESQVSEEELLRAKNHLKGSLCFRWNRPAHECPTWRGRSCTSGAFIRLDEILESIQRGNARRSAVARPGILPAGADRRKPYSAR